jgi:hypothetical protein
MVKSDDGGGDEAERGGLVSEKIKRTFQSMKDRKMSLPPNQP